MISQEIAELLHIHPFDKIYSTKAWSFRVKIILFFLKNGGKESFKRILKKTSFKNLLTPLFENDPKPLLYYEPELDTIVDVCKSQITAENDNGKRVVRNSTKFKHFTGTVSEEKGGLFKQKSKLKAISSVAQKQNITETVNQRHTRSSGPVPDQPWIRKRQF